MSKKEPWKDFKLSEKEWNELTEGEKSRMEQDLKEGTYIAPDQQIKDYKAKIITQREAATKQLEDDEKAILEKNKKEVSK